MDHCLNRQKHEWKVEYGMLVVCGICLKFKVLKRYVGGAFGKVSKWASIQRDMRVVQRHLREGVEHGI